MKIGMIGMSRGNGHPFSFSAIMNGYDEGEMIKAGWRVIADYLRLHDSSEFGFDGVKVTHAWTQDEKLTAQLCKTCFIPYSVHDLAKMTEHVDAVVIARDDYESHYSLALPFLEKGIPVFVDKPLSLDLKELSRLKPYLEMGQLMSCSAMRYARELDPLRQQLPSLGEIKLVRGTVVHSFEKYGIHLLETVVSLFSEMPTSIVANDANHQSFNMTLSDGSMWQLDALGPSFKTFHLQVWGKHKMAELHITDHFTMFRRMLWRFIQMVKTGKPPISPQQTLGLMCLLIGGKRSKVEKRRVRLDEVRLPGTF